MAPSPLLREEVVLVGISPTDYQPTPAPRTEDIREDPVSSCVVLPLLMWNREQNAILSAIRTSAPFTCALCT